MPYMHSIPCRDDGGAMRLNWFEWLWLPRVMGPPVLLSAMLVFVPPPIILNVGMEGVAMVLASNTEGPAN
jgi:hypothetical protein